MRIIYRSDYKLSNPIKEVHFFIFEDKTYEFYEQKSGKRFSIMRLGPCREVEAFIKRGWQEITTFRQFLTHPDPIIRKAAKKGIAKCIK